MGLNERLKLLNKYMSPPLVAIIFLLIFGVLALETIAVTGLGGEVAAVVESLLLDFVISAILTGMLVVGVGCYLVEQIIHPQREIPVASAQLGQVTLEVAGRRVHAEPEERRVAVLALDPELDVVRTGAQRQLAPEAPAIGAQKIESLLPAVQIAREDPSHAADDQGGQHDVDRLGRGYGHELASGGLRQRAVCARGAIGLEEQRMYRDVPPRLAPKGLEQDQIRAPAAGWETAPCRTHAAVSPLLATRLRLLPSALARSGTVEEAPRVGQVAIGQQEDLAADPSGRPIEPVARQPERADQIGTALPMFGRFVRHGGKEF